MTDHKNVKLGLSGGPIFGLKITIRPQPSQDKYLKALDDVHKQFLARGVPVSDHEKLSILGNRDRAAEAFDRILKSNFRMIDEKRRKEISLDFANMVNDSTLQAQLSKEYPTALDNLARDNSRTTSALAPATSGTLRALLNSAPPGGVMLVIPFR